MAFSTQPLIQRYAQTVAVASLLLAGCSTPAPALTLAPSSTLIPSSMPAAITATLASSATVQSGIQSSDQATTIPSPSPMPSPENRATEVAAATSTLAPTPVPVMPRPRLTSPLPTPLLPLETTFGVEMNQISADVGLPRVRAAGTRWVRRAGIPWREIEPQEGQRNWGAMLGLERELKVASDQGFKVIAVVRETPAWAQAITDHPCGPITKDKLGAFGAFMRDLVARYSAPPYNVRYWEIWNEPDIDYHLVAADSLWGCWGNADDDYYGGGDYGEMLKSVYPQVKLASPESQVLVGGLLLDCDPRNPPAGKDCKPSKFLEGVLRSGGGDYFDGIAFHAYDYYDTPQKGDYHHPGWNASASSTGPVVGVKAEYLRELLYQYGAQTKYLINTEMALVCGNNGTEPRCQSQDFQDTKAAYVVESYVTALTQGLRAGIWYTLLGWRGSGLLDGRHQPTEAYHAYRYAAQQFAGVTNIRELALGSGIRAFELTRAAGRLWVLWSSDRTEHPLTLPSQPASITDLAGQALLKTPSTPSTTIGPMPVYVTW